MLLKLASFRKYLHPHS